jgi:nucleoid DNA-binding protein
VVAVPSKNIPFFRMGKAMKDRINKWNFYESFIYLNNV